MRFDWLRKVLRVAGTLAGVLLFLAAFSVVHEYSLIAPGTDEIISPDEVRYKVEIISSAVSLINSSRQALIAKSKSEDQDTKEDFTKLKASPTTFRRDVHAKTHGCLKASFEVQSNLDPRLRQGLFAKSGTYKAWIRLSSGDTQVQDDKIGDARGFAIKVMGVPGEKLLEPEKWAQTHDFIMINSPVFFIQTAEEYSKFSAALGRGKQAVYGYFFGGPSLDPRTWRLRQMKLAVDTLKAPPDSLLDERYYSLSAYRLGSALYVKYGLRPCAPRPAVHPDRDEPNFLRNTMREELKRGGACFEFMVQPQVSGKFMPVEDATVLWSEKDSPFVPVAKLQIEKQEFDTPEQNTFCEDLSFNPWHALPEHRPVGLMNRLRHSLYQEIGRYRRCQNGVALAEPKDFSLKLEGEPCTIPASSSGPPGL